MLASANRSRQRYAERKSGTCDLLHKESGSPVLNQHIYPTLWNGGAMRQPSFDPHRDIQTDYVLIATGVAAALVALIYLLLV